jgi:hypothetical protein
MSRRRFFLLGLVLVVGAWFLVPSLCTGPRTPEERVRAAIATVADGVGEGDLVGALASISRSYRDPEGGDFAMIRGMLWRELQARGRISVTLGPIEVRLEENGQRAEARFAALLMDGVDITALDIRANNADAWFFIVDLELEPDDEWRITSHTRRDVRPEDVFR